MITLDSNKVDLYFGNASNFSSEELFIHLTNEEKIKSGSLNFEERHMYIVCKAILKLMIAKLFNTQSFDISFGENNSGKPYVLGNYPIKFSLSHSHDVFLIAFTQSEEIGVDIEPINREYDKNKLANFLLSDAERIIYESLNELQKHKLILTSWICKESFTKAKGVGYSFPHKQLELLILSNDKIEITQTKWDPREKENWTIKVFDILEEYKGAFAIETAIDNYTINKVEDLLEVSIN